MPVNAMTVTKVGMNASDIYPPKRGSKNEVPMKFVTVLADLASEKCMYWLKYVTKFDAFAKNTRFLKTSATAVIFFH